jgi:hypothetical protein
VDLVDGLFDGLGARVGAALGRKLASAPPGHVGCACRVLEPSRSRWRNGLIVVGDDGVIFRTRRSTLILDRRSLTFENPRSPSLRDRLRLNEGDRIYPARTRDARSVEIAVGRGRAAIMGALAATERAQ